MAHGKDLGYSVAKIFWALFILTSIEVAWGYLLRDPRWVLWSGLIICMIAKGLLIFMYFMHMRFERWLVWSLIGPTPALVLVVVCALMPDVAFNARRDHPNGYRIDATGNVVNAVDPVHPAAGLGNPVQHGAKPADEGAGN
jgi:cytochrome c oxidase subunit IV